MISQASEHGAESVAEFTVLSSSVDSALAEIIQSHAGSVPCRSRLGSPPSAPVPASS